MLSARSAGCQPDDVKTKCHDDDLTQGLEETKHRPKWKSLSPSATRTGGLKKQDLTMNKRGKVVSKKMHAHGKKAFSYIKAWHVAVNKARQALGVNGFLAIGGKRPEGKALYAKAKAILEGK